MMYPSLLSIAVAAASASTLVLSAPVRQFQRSDLAVYGEHLEAARAVKGDDLTVVEKRQLLCGLFSIGCDSPNTDSSGYAPWNVGCPDPWVWLRPAAGLSDHEQTYLNEKNASLTQAWQNHLGNLSIPTPPRTPVIGMALSGGGYRAMISNSGVAFQPNTSTGSVGDLEALSAYVAGLSGGSWAVGTHYANDGARPNDLVENIWNLPSNLVFPDDNKVEFYGDLVKQVGNKKDAGFETQITDYWGLALSEHLFPPQYHATTNPNLTMYELNSMPAVQNHSLPYPIIIAAEREPGEIVVAENATVWEFNLGDFGTWAWGSERKTMGAFTSVEYLGTNMSNGSPVDSESCYKGFSNLGFVVGTSATLFNAGLTTLNTTVNDTTVASLSTVEKVALNAIEGILMGFSETENDVATYPNPFYGWNSTENPTAALQNLTLVDAGETNQNVPLEPLLQPARGVDAIIAIDSSADTTYSWPNGSALYTTYTRAAALAREQNITLRMPEVPSTQGFINGGLNTRPTFFGCNDTTTPVIIYIPNYPWSTYSNTSTFQLAYENSQALAMIDNAQRTLGLNGTVSDWPTCLTCALVDNAVTENGANRSATCQSCFDRWCWNGQDDNTTSSAYEPVVGTVPSFIANL